MCVHAKWQKSVFFFVKRSVPEIFQRENFSGPVHLQIVFAYFECLTSIVCQVLQVAPPERRPLPGQAQVPDFISMTVCLSLCRFLPF